ncbi:hypothetical protein SAMN05660691_01761 [Rheinheimera pacifica]|uniref:Uncharacterized protein n=1 Tax=Rheinheimera pacifica TaxID=173990 RepID=A0A1H6LEY9_9GAMM|nr:hypothetical protein [Rheinheimera pacifica]SEH84729.1 hypothetical protein SAMN05660691_01761 [Rheinheimera pacifica]
MNALRRTPFYAATVGAVLALMPLHAAEVSPALKKNADILQTILQTAFKDNENSRLSSLQYSYLSGQGLLFQASSGGRHIFQFRNMSIPATPVAPVPPLPGGEFEFDSIDIEKITEAAEEMAEQMQDQHRQTYRIAEKQRAIERELRDVERDKRDIEFNKNLTKLDKEQQQELQMLQQKTKLLQEKLAEVAKEAGISRKQLEEQRAKQLAEQQQQTAAMVKTVGEKFSQVLCDYGASLRDMPDNEYVTLQVNNRGSEGRYYWVVKKADINQCMTGKIKAKDLLAKTNSYQF